MSDEVVDFVAKKGFDKDFGARPIRRALQNNVEDKLAEAMLDGTIHRGDTVTTEMGKDKEGKDCVLVKRIEQELPIEGAPFN